MSLDTRGAMSGFAQGFGMMDQYYANRDRQQMAERRLGMQEQQFEDNRAYQQELQGRQRNQWDEEDARGKLQNIFVKANTHGYDSLDENDLSIIQDVGQSRPDLLPPEFSQWADTNQNRQQQIGLAQDRLGQHQQSQQQRQGLQGEHEQLGLQQYTQRQGEQRAERLNPDGDNFTLGAMTGESSKKAKAVQGGMEKFFMGGEPTEEEAKALKDSPVDLTYIGTPEMTADMHAIDEQMKLLEQGEEVILQEALDAINNIYDFQVGEGKRITSILPGKEPGTLVFGLDVEDEDGARHAPMTQNRGKVADGDNYVKQVKVEDLIESLAGAKSLHVAFTTNPEAKERLNSWAVAQGMLPEQQRQEQWVTSTDEHGRVTRINAQTGKAESVHGALPAHSAGGGAKQDQFIQERVTSTMDNLQRLTVQEGEFGPLAPEIRQEQETRLLGTMAQEVFGPEGTPEMAQGLLQVARSEGRQPTMQDVQWILEETRRGEEAAMREMQQQSQQPGLQPPESAQSSSGLTWQGVRSGINDVLRPGTPSPTMSRLEEYHGMTPR